MSVARLVGGGLLFGLMLALVGCGGSSTKQQVVGKWQTREQIGGSEIEFIMDFGKDGSFKLTASPTGTPESESGTYRFSDDKTIETVRTRKGKDLKGKMKIESITPERMVLFEETLGKRFELTRIK